MTVMYIFLSIIHILSVSPLLLGMRMKELDPKAKFSVGEEQQLKWTLLHGLGISEGLDPKIAPKQAVLKYDEEIVPSECETILMRLVKDKDGRERVNETDTYPYRCFGKLNFLCDGFKGGGSGVLVGPHHVLTAAHCVFNIETNQWVDELGMYCGLNDDNAPFGYCRAVRAFVPEQYIVLRDSNFDIALVVLERSIGFNIGWLGCMFTAGDKMFNERDISVIGYPGDKGRKQMWMMKHRASRVEGEKIYYEIDTYKGQSGGPIISYFENEAGHHPVVVGIHTSGQKRGEHTGNSGVRITENKFREIMRLIRETNTIVIEFKKDPSDYLNNADDLVRLGDSYCEQQKDQQPDYEKARQCYEKAAATYEENERRSIAYLKLGDLYCSGYGVAKNYPKARKNYEKVLKLSDNENLRCLAKRKLADLYYLGLGVAKDITKALTYYEYVSSNADSNEEKDLALCVLGFIFWEGDGVSKDRNKASNFYDKVGAKGGLFSRSVKTIWGLFKDNGTNSLGLQAGILPLHAKSWYLFACLCDEGAIEGGILRAQDYFEKTADQTISPAIQIWSLIKLALYYNLEHEKKEARLRQAAHVLEMNSPNNDKCTKNLTDTEREEIRELLFLLKPDVSNAQCLEALQKASKNGYREVIRFLIRKGIHLHCNDVNGLDPLTNALKNGQTKVVELLVAHGAILRDDYFYFAASSGNSELMRFLIEKFGLPNDKSGLLHKAAAAGSLQGVEFLLEIGCDINDTVSGSTESVLHAALETPFSSQNNSADGDLKIIQLLVKRGADCSAKNLSGLTFIDEALAYNRVAVLDWCLSNAALINASRKDRSSSSCNASCDIINAEKLLHRAIISERSYETQALIVNHVSNCSWIDETGKNFLHLLAGKDSHTYERHGILEDLSEDSRIRLAQLLLSRNASAVQKDNAPAINDFLNAQDHHGDTPLLVAIQHGYSVLARFFIRQGADVKACNNDKVTPLHASCNRGDLALVSLLLERGVLIDVADNEGITPLAIAKANENPDLVELLVSSALAKQQPDKGEKNEDKKSFLAKILKKGK